MERGSRRLQKRSMETRRKALLFRANDHSLAFHRHGRFDAARFGQKAGVERLNAMGIEALAVPLGGQQCRHMWWNLGIGAGSDDLKSHAFAGPDWINADPAATGNGLSGDDKHIKEQFDPVLRR